MRGTDTNEHMALEELLYKLAENYFIRMETVMHTRVIRTPREENTENVEKIHNIEGARSGSDNQRRDAPVSYTHLDVYKRQILVCITISVLVK